MKTVTLDDDAYRLLKAAKQSPRESFSSVVKRTFGGRPRLRDARGGWADVPDERIEALRKEREAIFGSTGD